MKRSSKYSMNRYATVIGKMSFILILLIAFSAFSAPHTNQPFTFLQPDGKAVDVVVNGDEYYQRVESPDGFTLTRNSDGWICYATVSSDGSTLIPQEIYTGSNAPTRGTKHAELSVDAISKIREANRKAYDPESLTKRNLDSRYKVQKGNKIGLTILIDFSDQTSIVSKSEVESMLNSDNYGSYGSAKEYFSDVSGGLLTYTNHVVGYYRARNPKSYYDTNQSGGRTRELLGEALDWLDNNNFDFGSISTSNNVITAVNFFYAGSPTWGWAKGLWPHMSSYTWNSKSGYKTSVYQITGLNTSTKSIGTFCHENGHMLLGYPDLYPYSGSTNWVQKFCLMSMGGSGTNPVPMNPYFRYRSGWLDYEDITSVSNGSYQATSNDPVRAFIYNNSSNSNEAFIIEALQQTGRYSKIPGSGMVVWKLNKNGSNTQASNNNPLLAVAGGTGTGALIKNKSGEAFTSNTSPSATWPSGYSSNCDIRNVSGPGSSMTFDVGSGGTLDTMYTLDITAENGSVSTSPSGSSFKKGTSVSLTASASTGYKFVRWSGDVTGTSNTTSITMDDNKSVTAIFEEKDPTYTITINTSNGSVTKSPSKSEYNPGEEVTLTAKANSGYHFTGWGAELNGFEESITITMNTNLSIDAYFHSLPLEEDPDFGIAGGNRAQNEDLRKSFYAYGYSGGTVDTSDILKADGIEVPYSIPKQPDENTWPGADIMSFVEESLDSVTHVRLTYKVNKPSYLLLQSETENMAPWLTTLDAKDDWYTVDIPVSTLTQPTDWGMETGTYSGKDIKNVGMSPIIDVANTSGSGTVSINALYLIGIKYDKVSNKLTENLLKSQNSLSLYSGKLMLNLTKKENYSIELFSVSGRKVVKLKGQKNAGTYDLSSSLKGLASGLFVSRLKTSEGVKTITFTISK